MKFNNNDISKIMFGGQPVAKAILNGVQIFSSKNIISDSFNRADSNTLGTADTGQVWIPLNPGVVGISANQAAPKTFSGSVAAAGFDTGWPNARVKATFAVFPENYSCSLIFRRADAANTWAVTNFANSWAVRKTEGGATTVFASWGAAPQNGDIVEVVVDGTTIKLYINDILRVNTQSTFNQAATIFGISTYLNLDARVDNFNWEAI